MPATLIKELIYWFGFLMSAAFGNPIPEEVMIISGGIRASAADEYGALRWLILPACTVGAVVADVLLYGIGRLFGSVLNRWGLYRRLAPPEKQARIQRNFHKYGVLIFVIGRLVPGIRTTLFLTAGSMRMPLVKFAVADGVGAVFGTSLFFFLGYGLGAQFKDFIEHLEQQITPYKPILLGALFVAIIGYLVYLFFRHPIPTGDPEEVPLIGHQIATHLPVQEGDGEKASGLPVPPEFPVRTGEVTNQTPGK